MIVGVSCPVQCALGKCVSQCNGLVLFSVFVPLHSASDCEDAHARTVSAVVRFGGPNVASNVVAEMSPRASVRI